MSSNAWNRLGWRQQFRVVERVAKARRRELLKYPNAVDVCAGFREIGEQWDKYPCVKVFVERKWRTKAKRKGKIPTTVDTYIDVKGKRVKVRVPVDVSVIGTAVPHFDAGGQGSETRKVDTSLGEIGTGCCIVRKRGTNGGPYYWLGCAHTLAMVRRFRKPTSSVFHNYLTRVQSNEDGSGPIVGSLVTMSNLSSMDAALVHVSDITAITPRLREFGRFRGVRRESDWLREYSIVTRRGVI